LTGVTATPTGGSPSNLETNTYTGDGLLAASTNGSGTTTFLYDPQNANQLVGTGGTYYIYGPQRTPIEQVTGSDVDYLVPDAVGSTRTLVSAAGTIVGSASYSPYGEVLASAGTQSAIGFSGSYTDSITDMDYMTNRWYDPSVGEFISVDPLVAATSQAYEYGEDDPNVYVDPLGLWPCLSTSCLLHDAGVAAEVTTVVATVVVIGASVVATAGADAPEAIAGGDAAVTGEVGLFSAADTADAAATTARAANVAQTGFQCAGVYYHSETGMQCAADVASVGFGNASTSFSDRYLGDFSNPEKYLTMGVPNVVGFGSDLPIYGDPQGPSGSRCS
jgi:RHS repeat-associated protein